MRIHVVSSTPTRTISACGTLRRNTLALPGQINLDSAVDDAYYIALQGRGTARYDGRRNLKRRTQHARRDALP